METIEAFQEAGEFDRILNASFITIVPKKEDQRARYYMPTNLVGSIYKVISKVLSRRLKKVLDEVVFTPQNAFMEGRIDSGCRVSGQWSG